MPNGARARELAPPAWCLAYHSAVLASVMESTDVRAVAGTRLKASVKKNANGSCLFATSLNSRRCRMGRSCVSLPIAGFLSFQSAASHEFSMLTTKFTVVVVHGHHRVWPVSRLRAAGLHELRSWASPT